MNEPRIIKLKHIKDELSHLVEASAFENLPFVPERILWVYGFKLGGKRKQKSTRLGEQIFIALHGGFTVSAEWFQDGKLRKTDYRLHKQPADALYVPPCVWRRLYDFTEDAICLVLCSNYHDEADHIRDFEQFKKECG